MLFFHGAQRRLHLAGYFDWPACRPQKRLGHSL
jgi:hypothetical protein